MKIFHLNLYYNYMSHIKEILVLKKILVILLFHFFTITGFKYIDRDDNIGDNSINFGVIGVIALGGDCNVLCMFS